MTNLVNINDLGLKEGESLPVGYIYIGRKGNGYDGYFGNPPENGDVATLDRITIVKRYRAYFYRRIAEDAEFLSRVNRLKGLTLVCFCSPQLCHGMIIIEYLEGATVEEQCRLHRQADTERRRAIVEQKRPIVRKRPVKPNMEDMFD